MNLALRKDRTPSIPKSPISKFLIGFYCLENCLGPNNLMLLSPVDSAFFPEAGTPAAVFETAAAGAVDLIGGRVLSNFWGM
jgi:hypothetical protein